MRPLLCITLSGSGKRVTIRSIAAAAGVTPATVSYALRRDPRISEATQERICKLALELGYRPDPKVSRLMSYLRDSQKREISAAVGVLEFEVTEGVFTRSGYLDLLLGGAKERAEGLGYHLDRFQAAELGSGMRRLGSILEARGIHGLLIPWLPAAQSMPEMDWSELAAVSVANVPANVSMNMVGHCHFQGMRRVWCELRARGYERIGLVVDNPEGAFQRFRWQASFLAHQSWEAGITALPACTGERIDEHSSPYACQVSKATFRDWYQEHRPDCVIGLFGRPMEWLNELGVRVPEEVGYVDLHWLASMGEEVAGIDQCTSEVGAAAIDMLVGAIHRGDFGLPKLTREMLLPPGWCEGASLRKADA